MSEMQKINLRHITAAMRLYVFNELRAMMALGSMNFEAMFFGDKIAGLEYMQPWADTKLTHIGEIEDYWTKEKCRIKFDEHIYALNLGVSVLYFKMSSSGLVNDRIIIRAPGQYARHPFSDLAIDDPAPEYVFAIREQDDDFDVLIDSVKARESLIAGTDLHARFCSFMDVLELKQIRSDVRNSQSLTMVNLPATTTTVFSMRAEGRNFEIKFSPQDMTFRQADSVYRLLFETVGYIAGLAEEELGPFYGEFINKKFDDVLSARGLIISQLMTASQLTTDVSSPPDQEPAFEAPADHARQTHAFEMGVIDLIANRFGPLEDENAATRIQALVQILIDWNAKNPQTKIDPRAWSHLLVYAPENVMRETLEMKARIQ